MPNFFALWLRFVLIVVTNVGFAWTILGCAPVVDLVPLKSTAFQETLKTESTANARRAAHWMGQTVRGGSSAEPASVLLEERLPEGYTQNPDLGVWPSEYHLAYAALRLIREYYAATHPERRPLESDNLVDVVDEAGGNIHTLHDFDRDRHIDLADIDRRFVFEIVPPGQTHLPAAKKKVDWHLLLINNAMLGVPTFKLGTGYAGEIGVRFAEGAPPWKLVWTNPEPGIVVYRWEVLTVGNGTEDAVREAYAKDRWHEPTRTEMVRFGRALHEVVERLVQAREALGQTRAAAKMPILPGKTVGDYLRSQVLWSAVDDGIARLLPVMRGPPVQVRRNAHLLGETLSGGGEGDPQGGYTVKGRPGEQPWYFHLGNSAHKLIGKQYELTHVADKVRTNTVSISKIVGAAGGTETLLRADEALLRPDITNLDARVVFEIKSSTKGQLDQGKAEVARYIAAINRSMPPTLFKPGTGFSGDLWVRFTSDMRWWRLKWSTTAPGVIQYNWSKLNNDEVDEARIMKGVQEGRFTWVDLTEADMQQYAEKCAIFSEMYVNGSEKLYQVQVLTDFVVGVIGQATMVFVGSGLGPAKTAQPGAQAVTRPPLTSPARAPATPRMAPSPRAPVAPPPQRPAASPPP